VCRRHTAREQAAKKDLPNFAGERIYNPKPQMNDEEEAIQATRQQIREVIKEARKVERGLSRLQRSAKSGKAFKQADIIFLEQSYHRWVQESASTQAGIIALANTHLE
jgi:hypothetical protein